MGKSKKKKIDLDALEPLRQNPFAQLGDQLNLTPDKAPKEDTLPDLPANPKNQPVLLEQPMLLVRKEKRKKGKMVTCVYHLEMDADRHLKALKKALGTGGAFNGQQLEVQGDQRQAVSNYFLEKGFKVRLGN